MTVRLDSPAADPAFLARADEVVRTLLDSGAPDRATAAVGSLGLLSAGVPPPGGGRTRARWEVLATVAAADLTVARVLEAHLDALAILGEAPPGNVVLPAGATWGVYAAEAPGALLRAEPRGAGWALTGVKAWCSLADRLEAALVTAQTGDGRRLFAVDLGRPGVEVTPGAWVSRGLSAVTSGPVTFRQAPAVPVGDAGWYLRRPGFAYGGLGVAACWYGGAVGVARRLHRAAEEREPDQIALVHLGAVDAALHGARAVLAEAAYRIDAGEPAPALLAERVRTVVAGAAETALTRVAHALGPAPLTLEEEHARRTADLAVYLRQHHAERSDASLGSMLVAGAAEDLRPW